MFKNILLPVDITDHNATKISFSAVKELIKLYPDAKLTIIAVIQTYGLGMVEEYFPKGWIKDITTKTTNELKKLVEQNFTDMLSQVNYLVERGSVYQAILDTASKIDADLIVIPASDPNRKEYLLGPNVAKVVRHSDISVLVLRK